MYPMCTRTARDGPWTIGASERRRRLAAPRSQSLGRSCVLVCGRRLTCVDAVAKLARDGCRRRSLLHDCYTVDLDVVRSSSIGLPGVGTLNPLFQGPSCGLWPNSSQNYRLPALTTSGDRRLTPVVDGQCRWFPGSKTEGAACDDLAERLRRVPVQLRTAVMASGRRSTLCISESALV